MSMFSQRSPLPELIDASDVPDKDWQACLRELNIINTWLGGHKITTDGVQELVHPSATPVVIAEIGCGGGDNLKAIYRWAGRKKLSVQFIGIDLNKACTDFAQQNCAGVPGIRFIRSDYKMVQFGDRRPDIIFCSLFCHHFKDAELIEMLQWLKKNSRQGFFINDLHRHPVAWRLIKWITGAFSRSYLVKYDAPLSVLRGFRHSEWKDLLLKAGITRFRIRWKWAFRHLITVRHG